MRARFAVISFCICHNSTLANHTCYWPDGSVVPDSFDYTPCTSTATTDSACCYSQDPCTANGYCYGNAAYVYRGGCTDVNWEAEECCPSCRNVAIDIFSNIMPCPVSNGSYTTTFCCSEKAGTGCCDTTAFDFSDTPILTCPDRLCSPDAASTNSPSQLAKLSSTAIASNSTRLSPISLSIPASTTSASVLSAVATYLSQHPPPSKKIADIGAAIGVPLGVFLISGLTIFLIHERRLRIKAQKTVVDTLIAYDKSRAARTPAGGYELRDHPIPQELECIQPQPGELYDGEVHEADARN